MSKRLELKSFALPVVLSLGLAHASLATAQEAAAESAADATQAAAPEDGAPKTSPDQNTDAAPAQQDAAAPSDESARQPVDPVTTTGEAQPATAETVPVQSAEAKPATAPGSAVQLEDVVVTATKREKSLREIPASIAEFSGEKLEAQGRTNLSDYLSETPGVTLSQVAPNLPRISIRGISTDTSGLSGQPSPTGIFINDVAFTDPYISNMQPDLSAFDLASVEVLKGPQGTLFGGAALSGAVRYVLQDPQPGEVHTRVFTQYRMVEQGGAAATSGVAVNIPLYKDSLTARIDYVNQKYPGTTDNIRNPRRNDVDRGAGEQVRGILLWQPLDALKLKFTHLAQDYATPDSTTTADSINARETDKVLIPQPVSTRFSLDSLDAEYEFDSMRLVSLTSYSTKTLHVIGDATEGLVGPVPDAYPSSLAAFLAIDSDSKAFTQEIRLQSTNTEGFQWLVGAYLYSYRLAFILAGDTIAQQQLMGHGSLIDALLSGAHIDPSFLYNETSVLYSDANPKAQERALFFDVSDKFWDRLELSAGARVYSTQVTGGFFGTGVLARAGNMGQDINYSNNSLKESGVSPKATATWSFSKDVSLYGQISRGFRFGGLQSVPSTVLTKVPQQYKSDTLWNYESGLRTAWLDNTMHLDLTVFYDVFKNPQLKQSTQGVPLSFTTNVGGAVSRGLESSLTWLTPIPGLQLTASGALTDAYTTKPFEASDGTTVEPGTQMPGAAKYQYSAGLLQLMPLGPVMLGANASYTYVGPGESDITGAKVAINDYGTLNAGITLSGEAWDFKPTLSFNASNVLNETAIITGAVGKSTTQIPRTVYSLNAPRTFTMRLSLEF